MKKLKTQIYRVQDQDGRGPWKPGFSHQWVEVRPDHDALRPIMALGSAVLDRIKSANGFVGCGCRTITQLRRWFSPNEYAKLKQNGYRAMIISVDDVLFEDDQQIVACRRKPFNKGGVVFDLW